MRHHALILGLLLGCATPVQAQVTGDKPTLPSPREEFNRPVRFDHMTLDDGLSQLSILAIHQDREGFMWFGTQDGLNRYDGHTFKHFKHIPFDTTSITSNFVVGVADGSDGALWVATETMGLERMDKATGKFTHFVHNPADTASLSSNSIFSIEVSRDDAVWAATHGDGLNRMDPSAPGRFTRYQHDPEDPNSLSSDFVHAVYEDQNGTLWITTDNGLNRMDVERPGHFTRYLNEVEQERGTREPDAALYGVYRQPGAGVLWIGSRRGLVRFDPETGATDRFLPYPSGPVANFIGRISPDPEDEDALWAVVDGKGMVRFDTATETFAPFRHDPSDPTSLREDAVATVFADRSGTLWAGTLTNGISKFSPSEVGFAHYAHDPLRPGGLANNVIWGMHVDRAGALWAGTEQNYLHRIDRSTGLIRRWQADPENPADPTRPGGKSNNMVEDQDGMLWIATNRGLDRYNPATDRFTHYRHDPNDTTSISHFGVLRVFVDRAGTLWAGTPDGLNRFDREEGTFTRYHHDPEDEASLGGVVVDPIFEDHAGMLWAGTEQGLSRMDPASPGRFSQYRHDPLNPNSLTSGFVTTIHERSREPGVLWIGTFGGGLDRLDVQTGAVTHYTEQNSDLPNNILYMVLEDDAGRLWMSTNRGLSRFDPETGTFSTYGPEHGLQSLEFDQWSAAKAPNGELFFGGVNGINGFMPDQLGGNSQPPPVALTELRLFNRPVSVGPDSPLKQALADTREIELSYDEGRNVGFNFVALHFKNPEGNRYAYQLEGFDEDWIDAGEQRSATYTNLPPGRYTFRAKAANSDGVWNEAGVSVLLTILPPWWRTPWAYLLYGLAFVGSVVAADRIQRRRVIRKETELAEIREAQLLAEAQQRRRQDAERLGEMGRAITSTLSTREIIDTVYEHVNMLMDAAVFSIGIYNPNEQRIDFPATKENGETLRPYSNALDDPSRPAAWCFNNRKEFIVGDFNSEYQNYLPQRQVPLAGGDAASIIYLPLIHRDRAVGVITTQSFQKQAYTDYHVSVLRTLAAYAAVAIDNASAYRELRRTLDELKATQQQLLQQEKLASLGALTAGIAHEIKNPLNFVNNFASLASELVREVRDEMASDSGLRVSEIESILSDLQLNVEKIEEHGRRADGIVRSMLEHSRGGEREYRKVDINALAEEYIGLSYHGMRAQQVDFNSAIERDYDESVGLVDMIPQEIGRVLLNLLNNAFYAVYQRSKHLEGLYVPTVRVGTRRTDDGVEIRVWDNGGGIPEEIREKIFEPFFTTKPTGEGTGLGLSLSYEIVTQEHGGTLTVESVEGESTTFHISLPVSVPQAIGA